MLHQHVRRITPWHGESSAHPSAKYGIVLLCRRNDVANPTARGHGHIRSRNWPRNARKGLVHFHERELIM